MEQGQRGIIWKMNLYDKLRKKRKCLHYISAMSMTILLLEIIKYVINNNIEAEIK